MLMPVISALGWKREGDDVIRSSVILSYIERLCLDSCPASEKKKDRQTDIYKSVTETDKDTERIFSLKLAVEEK